MGLRSNRHVAFASAAVGALALAMTTPVAALGTPTPTVAATPVTGAPAATGGTTGASDAVTSPTARRGSPQVSPRRTELREGEPLIIAGHAAAGSTVRLSTFRGQRWTYLTPPVTVPRSGQVRISARLGRTGTHLVRADVVLRDRMVRYGLGPYVVTVAARGTRAPTYVTYPLAHVLRSPKVTASTTTGAPILVDRNRFGYAAAVTGAAYPQWTEAITADGLGCIAANLKFAIPDGSRDTASMRVNNAWAGRGAQHTTRAGTIGGVATPMDGGRFSIDVSGGTTVYLQGTLTCRRGALDR